MTTAVTAPQLPCHITRTTAETHRIIRADAHRSAVYSGAISGRGPRYCPSIEDKVIRFADRDSHQIFLEPEGVDDPTVYPNGISTSLPAGDAARARGDHSGPGARAHPASRLCDRIRLHRPARARSDARSAPARGPVPGRTDQRHDRLRRGGGSRAGRRASTPRARPAGRRSRRSTAPNPISA